MNYHGSYMLKPFGRFNFCAINHQFGSQQLNFQAVLESKLFCKIYDLCKNKIFHSVHLFYSKLKLEALSLLHWSAEFSLKIDQPRITTISVQICLKRGVTVNRLRLKNTLPENEMFSENHTNHRWCQEHREWCG